MLHEDPSTSAIAPSVFSSGNFTVEDLSHSYIIMDRLGSSLDNLPKAGLSTAAFVQVLKLTGFLRKLSWVQSSMRALPTLRYPNLES